MSNINLDPNFWGPSGWKFLHSIAEGYPEQPDEEHKRSATNFYSSLRSLLPCSRCCDHCCAKLESDPVEPHVESRDALVKWVFDFHNQVNERL